MIAKETLIQQGTQATPLLAEHAALKGDAPIAKEVTLEEWADIKPEPDILYFIYLGKELYAISYKDKYIQSKYDLENIIILQFDPNEIPKPLYYMPKRGDLKRLTIQPDENGLFIHTFNEILSYIRLCELITSGGTRYEPSCNPVRVLQLPKSLVQTTARYMFAGCNNLISINTKNWDTGELDSLSYTFDNCRSLKQLDLSTIYTEYVEDMEFTFNQCESLEHLDTSSWITYNCSSFSDMFNHCESLENLDISSFDTSNASDFIEMFANCFKLKELVINLAIDNYTDTADIFIGCTSLTNISGYIRFIKNSINFPDSGDLTPESIMLIFNALDPNPNYPYSISLHSEAYDRLTPEQIAVATSKGWDVISV